MPDHDVRTEDGRVLRAYDTGPGSGDITLVWHNGTPHTGALLEPIVAAAAARHLRLVSYARPSYGGSTSRPGRTVASAAGDVAAVADALGLDRFAVMGASGGGTHALACAALLPDRTVACAVLAAVALYSDEFDWFGGMAAPGALRAAREGRDARTRFAETEEFDPNVFTSADWAALDGEWAAVGADAQKAASDGASGPIDDDLAYASPWGFDLASIRRPVLVVHGGEDRMVPASHGRWLASHIPGAELWLRPGDGHVSVLREVPAAMDWLRERLEREV